MKVFFFGDSIGFGQLISPHKIWVNQISVQLEVDFPEVDFLVNNASISGNTTRMALERVAYDIQEHSPDLVVVQFGINDANYWQSDKGLPRVSRLAFEGNLQEIIDRSRNFGAKRVILNTNHPTSKKLGIGPYSEHQQSNFIYNQIVRKVAQTKEVALIDIETVLLDRVRQGGQGKDFLLQDGVHLNLTGHQLYFDNVYPIVKTCVAEILAE